MLQGFAADGQAEAIDCDDGQPAAGQLEQAAGVDGLGLIIRDGKNRLVNHGFEHVFGHWDLIFGVDFGHGREVVRG